MMLLYEELDLIFSGLIVLVDDLEPLERKVLIHVMVEIKARATWQELLRFALYSGPLSCTGGRLILPISPTPALAAN